MFDFEQPSDLPDAHRLHPSVVDEAGGSGARERARDVEVVEDGAVGGGRDALESNVDGFGGFRVDVDRFDG